jgi:hypothetical protein
MNYYQNMLQPTRGYTLATPISCFAPIEDIRFTSADKIIWYFDDGERYTATKDQGLSAAHIFYSKGIHYVSAVAHISNEFSTETYTAVASCYIVNYLENYINFVTIPPPTYPGFFTRQPFKIQFTANELTVPQISLYSQFSRSYPPQTPPNKWSFIRPEWRFTDLNGEVISSITPNITEIKIDKDGNITEDGVLVGLSGFAEFYYVDDIYNVDLYYSDKPTTIIWATLPTSGSNYKLDSNIKIENVHNFSNSKLQAYAPFVSYWKLPDYLKITENGIQDFINPKWSNASIPFLITSQIDENNLNGYKKFKPEISFVKYLPFSLTENNIPQGGDITVNTYVPGATGVTFNSSLIPEQGVYKFKQIDDTGYTSPGFALGSVNVNDSGFYQISARATLNMLDLHLPEENFYSPYVWVPNPAAGTLSLVYYLGNTNLSFLENLVSTYKTNYTYNINTPVVTNLNTTSANLTGFNGMYAVAASPGQSPDYDYYGWVADADLDTLYKYNTEGNLITSINLQDLLNIEKVTPASISLDSQKNLWVTCYDTLSVLKFDRNGNLLFGIDSSIALPQINPNVPGIFEFQSSSIFNDVNIVTPTCIESDFNDDVWVTYSNPLSSYIVKYSQNGNVLNIIKLPLESSPHDIIVNSSNEVWVAAAQENNTRNSSLMHFNSSGVLLQSYNITNLNQITLDLNENIWFTYDYNNIGKIFNNTFIPVASVDSSYFTGINSPPLASAAGDIQFTALEGIACTNKNLIFVVHSIDNKIYIFDANTNNLIDTLYIKPHLTYGFFNDKNSSNNTNFQWNKSIQVTGDWTGIKWSIKYKNKQSFTETEKTITGTSKTLSIKKYNDAEIRKHNQDFDMASNLSSLALTSRLKSNAFLFDNFFKAIYGAGSDISDVGTVFYEKAANFLDNVRDIDTCEIDHLYDIAHMLDTFVDDYRLTYPAQLKQIMNLLSVTHSKLWGIRCRCNMNFKNQNNCTLSDICKICGKCKESNRGEKINLTIVTANKPFVIYDKNYDSYYYHYPPVYNGSFTYPINQLSSIGLTLPIENNYEFYEYIPNSNQTFVEGVIDWSNPHTLLNPALSTYSDWINSSEAIDTILSFYLYKGLGYIN